MKFHGVDYLAVIAGVVVIMTWLIGGSDAAGFGGSLVVASIVAYRVTTARA
jgi:hypothetical protein